MEEKGVISKKSKITNVLIDVAGFAGGNYILAEAAGIPKPKIRHLVIFGAADYLVRQGKLGDKKNYVSEFKKERENEDLYIAMMYLIGAVGYDVILGKKELSQKTVINNVIRAAIGFGTNLILDRNFVTNKYE